MDGRGRSGEDLADDHSPKGDRHIAGPSNAARKPAGPVDLLGRGSERQVRQRYLCRMDAPLAGIAEGPSLKRLSDEAIVMP
jgi:hypothetical protein